jgi:hypothetical protein
MNLIEMLPSWLTTLMTLFFSWPPHQPAHSKKVVPPH